jgi:hypothetical protein
MQAVLCVLVILPNVGKRLAVRKATFEDGAAFISPRHQMRWVDGSSNTEHWVGGYPCLTTQYRDMNVYLALLKGCT